MALSGRRQRDLEVRKERHRIGNGVAGHHHRHHVGERRSRIAAFGERTPAAEQQQAAAAHVHEVGKHRELIVREEARLDAAEDHRAVAEQLGARFREAGRQLVGAVDVQAEKLVLGGPLQRDELEVRVGFDGRANEAHLRARLALEIENLLTPVAHVDERLLRVVLRDLLAGLRRDAERERSGAGVVSGDAHAHRRDVAVGRKRDRVARHDAPAVLDDQRNAFAGVAALANQEVGDERSALEHGVRGLDPPDLDVLVEPVRAESDGEDRNRFGAKREQLVGDRRARVVGAVAHDHESRKRHGVQLLARLLDRRADVRLAGVEREIGDAVDALGARGKAEQPNHEFLAERLEQRAVRTAEGVFDPVARGLSVAVGDAHAARVVDQHADVVALRDRRREQQHRPEETEASTARAATRMRAEHPPIALVLLPRTPA